MGEIGRVSLGDLFSLTQHRKSLGDGFDLAQFVRDEDHGETVLYESAEGLEKGVGLLGGQDRGGLVENQQLNVPVEGLEDFDPLLLAHRKVLHASVGIDMEAVSFGKLTNALAGGVRGELTPLGGLVAEDDVFPDRKGRNQHKMLMNHPNARFHRIDRRSESDFFALPEETSLGRREQPKRDVHQGGLACAVFTEKSVNFALLDGKVDLLVGDDPSGKTARDLFQAQ